MAVLLPEIIPTLGRQVLDQIIGSLINPPSTSNVDESVTVAIEDIWSTFGSAIDGIGWDMYQEKGAKLYEEPLARGVAWNIEYLTGTIQATFDHVAFTLLPNSLGKLEHDIYVGWIVPLMGRVAHLEWVAQVLWDWSAQINTWRQSWVDPHLRKLDTFLRDFYAFDQPAINTLIDWLRYPAHFGQWAAAPATPYILGFLSEKQQKPQRDFLSWIVLYGFEEQPDLVADAVVQLLNQPVT